MKNLFFKTAMWKGSRTTVNRQSTDGQVQRRYSLTPISKRWKALVALLFLFSLSIGQMWAAVGDAEVVSLTSGNITANYAKAYAVTTDNDVLADAAIYATSRNANTANANNGIEPSYMGFLFKPVVNCKVVLKGVNTTTSDRNFSNKVFEVTNTDMYPMVKASSSYDGSISKYLLANYSLYTTRTQSEWKDVKLIKYGNNKYQEDATNAAKTVTGEAAQSALYTQITTINVISITKKASSGADNVVESKTFSTSEGEYIFQAGKTYAIYLHRNSSGLYVKELSFVPVYQLNWALDGGSITSAADDYTNAGYYAKGTELTAPTVTKAGADFAGWSPAVAATMPAAATTYTATWATACSAGVPGNVTKGALTAGEITLTAEGSAASGDTWYWQTSESGVDKTNEGSSFVATAAGTYYVRSHNTAADCWNVTAKSIELTAEDFKEKYAITYNKGTYGTGEIAGGEKVEGVAYTLSSDRFTRAGYVQVGWALTNGGTKAYDLGGSYTTDAEQEFFPVWAETSTYVASFACGATAPAGWTFSNAGYDADNKATVDYVCNFVAAGMNTPKQTETGDKTTDDDVAFAKNTNAIATYDLGAATTVTAMNVTLCGGSGNPFDETIEYLGSDGTTVKKSYVTSLSAGNWKDNAINKSEVVDGVRYIRVHGASKWVVMKAFSVTYVDLATKYNVSFDKNGGSGDDMATLKYAEGAEVTLPACTFTAPENKEFDAWTSTDVTISNNKFTMPNKAVTIKATWKFLPKLTLTAGEGAMGDDEVAYYAAGTQISVPEKPEGFSNGTKEFTGWVYSSDVEITDGAFPMPSSNLTLTAQWASATAVAQILGGDSYETFAKAIEAVADGETIQLLQDCSYSDYWTLEDKDVTVDLNGKHLSYTGTNYYGVVLSNGTLTVEDQTMTDDPTIDLNASPLNADAITYTNSGKWTFTKAGVNVRTDGEMVVESGWMQTVECVACPMYNGIVTVNNGVLVATDNGVLMGNGTNGLGGYTINVHGGILLGMIQSVGYASMAIYHPNTGTLNIDGGTLVSTKGPGVVCRGGESNITGGTIVAKGEGSGKCGDASLVLKAVGVAYDFKAAYPGVSSFDATISGTANVSGEAGAVMGNYAGETPTTAEKDAVAISGGTFNSPVAQALCAENYAPKDNGDGTYGVKPLAQSIDLATYAQSHTGTAWQGYLTDNGYAYVVGSESKAEISLDNSNAFDRGLKLKQSTTSNISFEVAAGKLITIVTGKVNGLSIAINGAAATAITGGTDAEHLATSYYYNAAAQNVVITETNTGYNIIREIKIENPYVVTYNTHGADPIAAATFTGTAITLPTPANGTGSFKGWYDAATEGNLIGAAGASYTPTANITLHAQWELVSTVNTLSDLQVDGTTIDGFDPATNIYYLVYEYGQQPEITSATATAGALAEVTINNAPVHYQDATEDFWYVQVKVVPESGESDQKFYQVRYTNKPKKGVEIIKVMIPNGTGNAQVIDAENITGYIGGTANQKLESGKHKLGSGGHYIGITLAEGTFLENDLVNVNIETVTGDKLRVFSENTAAESKVVAQSAANMVAGVNTVTLDATTTNSLYLRRGTEEENYQKSWNPFVGYISVERYMNPFIKSFKIGEAVGTIDQVNKTIAVEVPYATDVTALNPDIAAYANGGATLDKTGAQDFSSPVTYKVSSAYAEDGDVTYTVTVNVAAHYEAQIGETKYSAVADAMAAAADGQTITLLDNCSYSSTWNISGKNVKVNLNGKTLSYNGTGYYGVTVANGKLTVEDQTMTVDPTIDMTADPLNASAITYTSGKWTFSRGGVNVLTNGEMVVNSGWMQTVECVACPMYNGIVTVNNGVLVATDNGVLMGNGSNGKGGYTINVHGGILLGMIQSAGYASMAIYHPNTGVLNIDGGILVSTNGPGVVVRAGESHITGGTIVAQGTVAGKCGDANAPKIAGVGVAYDFKANYPGEDIEAIITGGDITGEVDAVQAIYAATDPTPEEVEAIAISGGQFSSEVDANLCAEGFVPVTEPNAQGKYEVEDKRIYIFKGTTSSATMATSPSGAIAWVNVNSAVGSPTDKSGTYDEVSYVKAVQIGNSSTTKHFRIDVALNNNAKIEVIGMSNSNSGDSKIRHAWLTNSTDKGEIANAIASLESDGYNPAEFETEWLEEGSYYLHADNTVNIFLIRVTPKAVPAKCEQPTITDMANSEICEGDAFEALTVSASVPVGGTLHYQWYKVGETDAAVGTDAASYTPNALGQYYVVVTNRKDGYRDNSATSNTITVSYAAATEITTAPLNKRGEVGNVVTLTVAAIGKNLAYKWYTCNEDGSNEVALYPAQTEASLDVTVTAGMAQWYKVKVTGDCGNAEAMAKVSEFQPTTPANVTGSMLWDWHSSEAGFPTATTTMSFTNTGVEELFADVDAAMPNNEYFRSDMLYGTGQIAWRNTGDGEWGFQGKQIRFKPEVAGMVRIYYRAPSSSNTCTITIDGKPAGSRGNSWGWSEYVQVPANTTDGIVISMTNSAGADKFTRVQKIEFLAKIDSRNTYAAGDLGTACYKDDAKVFGAKVYELNGINQNGYMVFDEILSGEIQAGMPYLFEATGGEIGFYATVGANHVDEVVSVPEITKGMYGTFVDVDFTPTGDPDIYYFSGRHIWAMSKRSKTITVPAYRCYVDYAEFRNHPATAEAPAGRRRVMLGVNGGQVATGIENAETIQEGVQKIMIDGQLFILRGEKMYDATGRLVK